MTPRVTSCSAPYVAFCMMSSALLVFSSCRSAAPDSGGDISLARDLAAAQLAGSTYSAGAGGAVAIASDNVAAPSVGADYANPDPPERKVETSAPAILAKNTITLKNRAPARTHLRNAKAKSASAASIGDPCAALTQDECMSRNIKHLDERLDTLDGSIVTAVRKQQHIPPGAPDPVYVTQLRQAEDTWIAWRNEKCDLRIDAAGKELWAARRTKCLTDLTSERAAELDGVLSQVRSH